MLHPRDVIHVDAAPHEQKSPCDLLFARIDVSTGGVSIPHEADVRGTLASISEAVFGWAAPAPQAVATARTVPVHITFERAYLGGIPATSVSLLMAALVVLPLAVYVYRRLLRHLSNVVRKHE